MRMLLNAACMLAVFASSLELAQGQTCASPIPLQSNTTTNGTTCAGIFPRIFGPVVFAHPSVVYSFVYVSDGNMSGAEPDRIALATNALPHKEMALVPSCNDDAFPGPAIIAAGDTGGNTIPLDSLGLIDGTTYYLLVTVDPFLPIADPALCGDFQIATNTLPVELQSFTID